MKVRIALAAFGAAALLLAWTLWQAVRVNAVVASPGPRDGGGTVPTSAAWPTYSAERVLAAVDKDPFHPARRRPAVRFRLPHDMATARSRSAPTTSPGVRVIGTAVRADGGGFAMCSWAGGQPRIVRVGERVGEWTLSKVTPGAAEFRGSTGTTVVVRIAKAGGGT